MGFDVHRNRLKFVNVDVSLYIIVKIVMFCIGALFYLAYVTSLHTSASLTNTT